MTRRSGRDGVSGAITRDADEALTRFQSHAEAESASDSGLRKGGSGGMLARTARVAEWQTRQT